MLSRTLMLAHNDDIGWSDLHSIIQRMSDVIIVGNATTGPQTFKLAAAHRPDALLLSAMIDGSSAVSLLATLRQGPCAHSIVAIFAAQLDPTQLTAFVNLGISGFFIWSDIARSVLEHSLSALISGKVFVGSCTPAQAYLNRKYLGTEIGETLLTFSPREAKVLQGLARGLTRKEMAVEMKLSQRTIDRTVERLEQQFDAHNLFVLGLRAALLGAVVPTV